MQEDRRLAVLRAIVEDYVSTEEPVGSKALVERHGLGVSPATVRNDMAVLEEEGYITQPHTSAGRVPTDKGYRMFVDRLTTVKPLSSAEKRAISSFLDGAVDLDDVVQRSVRLLSQLTRQVAVVQYPTLSSSTVRHVELVALTPERLLVVLILSTGRVEQRLVDNAVNPARLDRVDMRHQADIVAIIGTDILQPIAERLTLGEMLAKVRPAAIERVAPSIDDLGAGQGSTSVVSTGYGPEDQSLATLGIVGPTRMDYPGTMAAVRAVARYVTRILDEA